MGVSVALATYNGEKYLPELFESISNQSRQPDEVVICDDNSSDNTVELSKNFKKNEDFKVKIIENDENIGVRKNIGKVIQNCSEDLIATTDQDDVWYENKLDRMEAVMNLEDVPLVFHNSEVVTACLKRIDDLWSIKGYEAGTARRPTRAFQELVKGNYVRGGSSMFTNDLLDHIIPLPNDVWHDWYIAFNALLLGGLYDIDAELDKYRQHNNQTSKQLRESNIGRILRGINEGFDKEKTFKENIRSFETLRTKIDMFDEDEIILDKDQAIRIIENRMEYEKNRKRAYDNSLSRNERLRSVVQNLYYGHYKRYGTSSRYLYGIKDGIASIR